MVFQSLEIFAAISQRCLPDGKSLVKMLGLEYRISFLAFLNFCNNENKKNKNNYIKNNVLFKPSKFVSYSCKYIIVSKFQENFIFYSFCLNLFIAIARYIRFGVMTFSIQEFFWSTRGGTPSNAMLKTAFSHQLWWS